MNDFPVALSIAGSDNSAGAGIQADLKTFTFHQVYGLTALTCVVAEVPGQVTAIQPVAPEIVADQIRLSFQAYPVAAVKTGLLYSRSIIEVICDELEMHTLPLVIDPVMIASSGDPLLRADAVALYENRLFKRAAVVTPNLDETGVLLGRRISTLDEMREAGLELTAKFGVAFLIKGGHLRGDQAVDLLFVDEEIHELNESYIHGVSTHGTGCTYSAAITAGLAKGLPLVEAVFAAKRFVTQSIARHFHWQQDGMNTQALNHF